jgi:hypothetical protein
LNEVKLVKVICPKCNAENSLPDNLERKTPYSCYVCKRRFSNIVNKNLGRVAAYTLIAWWAIPVLVWKSVSSARGASEYSAELNLAYYGFLLSTIIGVAAIGIVVYYLGASSRHRKLIGVYPIGYKRFILISVLGSCTCFAASGLAFAWWKWWA